MNKLICPHCQTTLLPNVFYNLQLGGQCPSCGKAIVFQPHIAVAPVLFVLTLFLREMLVPRLDNALLDLFLSLAFAFVIIIILGVGVLKLGFGQVKSAEKSTGGQS